MLLSFIVPCYNVEKYIQRCLDSIFACNLPEEQYEVVCINDCSPDNVQLILEQNRLQHENLRIVVHEQNKGLGGARNTGIKEAKGKYLWFVDSDDTIMGSGLKTLVDRAVDERVDVLCFNYRRVDDAGNELSVHQVFGETESTDGILFVKSVFGKDIVYHMGYVVRFLYKTEYLRSHLLRFPENVRWEDTVFMPKALMEAERVAAVPQVLYSYRMNPDSISSTFTRAYPAVSIYEFAFCAGGDLLRFSNEVNDTELQAAFRNAAMQRYINGFPIHLFRTSRRERKAFYEIVAQRIDEVEALGGYMNMTSRLMLLPVVGRILAEVGAVAYKAKHKCRR